ncbi:ABC transporter substrate-binding protein, partial [Oceanospirillum sp. HFRX-1_2]
RAVFLLNMDSKLRMAGSQTGGGALISLTGARNLADYDNYRSISVEALVAMQPTLILVSTRAPNEGVERFLKSNPLLLHTPAGQSGKVYAVDGRSIVSGGLSVSALTEAQRLSDLINDRSVTTRKNVPAASLADTGE